MCPNPGLTFSLRSNTTVLHSRAATEKDGGEKIQQRKVRDLRDMLYSSIEEPL